MGRKHFFIVGILFLVLFSFNVGPITVSEPQSVSIEGKWEIIGPDGGDMHFVYVTKNQVLFASHGFGGVWRSTDLGENWELIYNPEWIDLNFLAMSEADGVIFGGGNYGIWKSKDDGKTWTRVVTGDSCLDSSPAKYEVVSIVALSESHIFFSVRISKSALRKGFKTVKHGFFELKDGKLKFYELPESASAYVVVMLAYDQDFNGKNLMFVSSCEKGLYAYDFSTGKWEKILDRKTTRVAIDYENDYVYVGTIGDWYYKIKLSGGKWSWEQITVPGKTCPVAGFIVPDPYNPERLWIGTETGVRGSLYRTGSKERRVATFVGVGFWKNGKWYDLRINSGWAPVVAIVTHKEGEDQSRYIIETDYGIGAKIAFVPRPGKGNIQKTEDGGKTWKRSYNGIYGDTINKITLIETGLRKGDIVVTCVSGTQVTKDLGDSWEEGIDLTIGDIGYGLPGYAWGAASPEEKLEGRYDLLIATGYPPSYFTGNGVYALDTETLKSGGRDFLKRIVEGPCYELVVVGNTLYVGRMDGGVDVVDLRTYSVSKLEGIPSDEAGMNVRYYNGTLIVFTIKGGSKDMDNYFFTDTRTTGGIYVFVNDTCKQIYKGKRVINIALHGNELVALTVEGKILHFTNFVKDWEVDLPPATYSDIAVDWDNRIVFLSTFDEDNPGVLYGELDNLKTTGLKPLEGILTRRVRCLLLVDNYLFAGTEGHSVWRFKITKITKPATTYSLTLSLSKTSVNMGGTITISGKISPATSGTVKILVSINGSEYSEIGSVSLSNGQYIFQYTPQSPGTYVFKAECIGPNNEVLAVSDEKQLIVSRITVTYSLTLKLSATSIHTGERVVLSGTITPSAKGVVKIYLSINGSEFKEIASISLKKGKYMYEFSPRKPGTYVFKAKCLNMQNKVLAESEQKTLTVLAKAPKEKIKPKITITISKNKVNVKESVTVSGTVSPPFLKVNVIIVINGPEGTFTHTVAPSNGQFSFTFRPPVKGVLTIYAKIEETDKVESAISNTVTLTVEEKKCIIATVAFGSEISPEVSFLRHFRNDYILTTFAGRSFYIAFDAFYYSWSPYVARAIRDSEPAKAIIRLLIYPLIGILKLTALLSLPLFSFSPEAASIAAGFIASTLIGVIYFTPIAYIITRIIRRRRINIRKTAIFSLIAIISSLSLIGLGILLQNEILTATSTSIYVITLVSFSALATQQFLRKSAKYIKTKL